MTIGYDAQGKRITRKASGKTKTQAKTKLRELLRDQDDGVLTPIDGYTVADAVAYWLTYGLRGRDEATVSNYTTLAKTHILPTLGRRKLRELSAEDVDQWLTTESRQCSTRTLRLLHSILSRSIRNAQARDKVRRNVVLLCDVPTGRKGRPSKALTLSQATAVINAAAESRLYAYIVLSLLIGARTEELRALRWCHVDLSGNLAATLRSRRQSRCCARSAPGETPKPAGPGGLWPCRNGAWTRSARYGTSGHAGTPSAPSAIVWCSRPASGRRWTRTMCGVTSGRSPRPPGS